MRLSMPLAVVVLLSLPVCAAEGDANTALDRQVFDVLKELNNRGADLNNIGDSIGCYRTYQGGLVVLRAMLVHRPPAQKIIDDGMKAAERKPLPERAFALHTTITELRAILKPATTPVKPTIQMPDPAAVPASFPADPKLPMPNIDPPKPAPATPTNPPPASFPAIGSASRHTVNTFGTAWRHGKRCPA